RVDLPPPGSPASRRTPPGTTPPPSTRSNSAMPDAERSVDSAFTSVIGRAPTAGVAGAVRAVWVIPASSTVPHAWHWPQRPTHFPVVQPHSPHPKPVLGLPSITPGYRLLAQRTVPRRCPTLLAALPSQPRSRRAPRLRSRRANPLTCRDSRRFPGP